MTVSRLGEILQGLDAKITSNNCRCLIWMRAEDFNGKGKD